MSCIGKTNDLKRSFKHDLIFLANQKAFFRGAAVDRLGDKKKKETKLAGMTPHFGFYFTILLVALSPPLRGLFVS